MRSNKTAVDDTSIGGWNVVDYNMNSLTGFRFLRNKFTSVGPGCALMEMTDSTVTGNKITGSGAHASYVGSPATPNTGKYVIHGNTVKGYRAELFIDLALHPGTVLTGNE